ncbi:hypothetical protein [Natrinema caseinilyticum]|uniref:hypothetical protein n=1 Tax=Natrinema caseinilyticum TaxID=2961570 RepID=UPI0020C2CD80|nr:hypothetical protein [Natrinema caseinilyticum]
MGPVDLYTIVSGPTLDSLAAVSGHGGSIEAYRSLDSLVRAGVQFVGTILLAAVVLGLLQGVGTRSVAKSRRSPIISICVGLPSLLVVAGLTGTGIILVDTSVGIFFAIPLVVLGVAVLPIAVAVGFTAVGRTVASRFSTDGLFVGVFVSALLCGLAGTAFPATVALISFTGALGLGASIRVLFGGFGAARPEDRTVPPANKI